MRTTFAALLSMAKQRSLAWMLALALTSLFAGWIFYTYGFSSSKEINNYYGNLLHRRALNRISGPHYWKDGRIFWAQNNFLKSSDDLGATARNELALPDSFKPPARFLSDSILADYSHVYLKRADAFQKVLDDFLCWYICGAQLNSGDFLIGEYGNRIYRVDHVTGQASLVLKKPSKARHFHVTAVDPLTSDAYVSLGDALNEYKKYGDRVTGIMRSQDEGRTWEWIYQTIVGAGDTDRQPTAVYFDKDVIYFGTDCKPHGIFTLNRNTGAFQQVFVMNRVFHSWFTQIRKAKGSFLAISRSFGRKNAFGVLWWSEMGKDWTPIQIFKGTPVWLQVDNKNDVFSVGFFDPNSNVIAFHLPSAGQMAEWVSHGPTITLLDRLFRQKIDVPNS